MAFYGIPSRQANKYAYHNRHCPQSTFGRGFQAPHPNDLQTEKKAITSSSSRVRFIGGRLRQMRLP